MTINYQFHVGSPADQFKLQIEAGREPSTAAPGSGFGDDQALLGEPGGGGIPAPVLQGQERLPVDLQTASWVETGKRRAAVDHRQTMARDPAGAAREPAARPARQPSCQIQ